MAYFWGSIAVLAALLYLPVTRLIWVLSVRRLERRRGQELPDAEIQGQLKRARLIATLVCIVFAYFFVLNTTGLPTDG
ncbi:MAG: hypothetical protein GWO02_09225 [Gammaproteobacteria bacterium]|nr:hypothetical protein [Gammaproteobacteria bacterium]